MNGLNNFDKTDREYSIAPVDDTIRFWRSKVKVTAALVYGGKGIHVDAAASKSSQVKFIKQQRAWKPLTCCILDKIVKHTQNILAFKSTSDITNS